MLYNFSVEGLNVTCTNHSKIIISDSVNYHMAHFDFAEEWLDYSKTITFTNSSTEVSIIMELDSNNNCIIPWESLEMKIDKINFNVTTKLVVAVHGFKDDVEIWTSMRNPLVLVKSDKSDYITPTEPSRDIISQIIEELDTKGDAIEYDEDTETLNLKRKGQVISSTQITLPIVNNDYEQLDNLPKVNGNTLIGDKNNEQLGIPIRTSELENDKDFMSRLEQETIDIDFSHYFD